jgi:hypothetical protein
MKKISTEKEIASKCALTGKTAKGWVAIPKSHEEKLKEVELRLGRKFDYPCIRYTTYMRKDGQAGYYGAIASA